MRDEIAKTYPDMAAYAALYTHDSIPWCGLATAYAMTMAGIRPVFGKPTLIDGCGRGPGMIQLGATNYRCLGQAVSW